MGRERVASVLVALLDAMVSVFAVLGGKVTRDEKSSKVIRVWCDSFRWWLPSGG